MRAGPLRHRITIQELVTAQNEQTGNFDETWPAFAENVPAEVRPSSVREFVAAGINSSKVTAAIKIRYMAGIKQSMRVLHGEHVYNIEGVLEDDKSGREWITLPVSEVQLG